MYLSLLYVQVYDVNAEIYICYKSHVEVCHLESNLSFYYESSFSVFLIMKLGA